MCLCQLVVMNFSLSNITNTFTAMFNTEKEFWNNWQLIQIYTKIFSRGCCVKFYVKHFTLCNFVVTLFHKLLCSILKAWSCGMFIVSVGQRHNIDKKSMNVHFFWCGRKDIYFVYIFWYLTLLQNIFLFSLYKVS